jgi:transposase-like protein
VASALGISIMTFHRWRKAHQARPTTRPDALSHTGPTDQILNSQIRDQIATLRLENLRLRRLLTDVLLEKIKLEETFLRPSVDGATMGQASH